MVLTTDDRYKELNAHQKAGLITILIHNGSDLTTEGIARITGMTWEGAEYMMDMLSGVLPLDKIDGKWKWVRED